MTSIISSIYNIIYPIKKYKLKAGSHSIQGHRPHMEDTKRIVKISLPYINTCYAVILCDGHAGELCSKYIIKELPKLIQINFKNIENTDNIIEIITNLVFQLDNNYKKMNDLSGSTCILTIFLDESIYIVNIGDSRTVIGNTKNQVLLNTIDHKPSLTKESNRIIKNGGKIMFQDTERIYVNDNAKGLAISRVIGDLHYKGGNVVVCNPDIYKRDILQENEFIILASDGLWDVITNHDAVKFVNELLQKEIYSLRHIAKKLVNYALLSGSMDNITVIICSLKYI
jgi:serine/threonine protein phosphatase PrpC